MRLSLLLYLLGVKLRWSARLSARFRARLRRVDRLIVIRTADGRYARSYLFRADTVRHRGGVDPEATAEMVWSDAAVAFRTMLAASVIENFSAIGRGDLVINGNLQDALWFSDIAG